MWRNECPHNSHTLWPFLVRLPKRGQARKYPLNTQWSHFSVHYVHQIHLNQLKKWVGLPSKGCTNLSIFDPHVMNIQTPSEWYLAGHAGYYLNCKRKADSNVQLAIESQLNRESQWTAKSSTVVQCERIFQKVSENHLILTPTNCNNYESSLATQTPILKAAVRNEVQLDYMNIWETR